MKTPAFSIVAFLVGFVTLGKLSCYAEDSVYVICRSEEVFCCEINGNETYVVQP